MVLKVTEVDSLSYVVIILHRDQERIGDYKNGQITSLQLAVELYKKGIVSGAYKIPEVVNGMIEEDLRNIESYVVVEPDDNYKGVHTETNSFEKIPVFDMGELIDFSNYKEIEWHSTKAVSH